MQKVKAYAQRVPDAEISANYMDFSKPIDDDENKENQEGVDKELMQFEVPCTACTLPGMCKMCIATIPFFKEIIIMAYSCEHCGFKSTEIKQGGGIAEKATKISFAVNCPEDICRDVFKSDTAEVYIPEIDFTMTPGTLGSMYTTVEGLLEQTVRHLKESNPFSGGDSTDSQKFMAFLDQME